MTRTRIIWKVRDHIFTLGERTLLMGVLNVTPDSFSDGGKYLDPDAAVARAMQLEEQGADIIDIGAESTKPGSERISAGEELRRLIPVLKRLKERLSVPISVDTYKAEVAEKALEHGASIINDISALTWEPDLVKPVVKYDAGLILNHMRGTPETWARLGPMKDVMGTLLAELEAAIHRATRASVARERIVIDPGIGFGKRGDQNSEILARLGELQRLGFPVLAAVSRKSFLNQEEPTALEYATAGAVAAAILNGAAIVRVHDVAAMKAVVNTMDAIVQAAPEREEKAKPAVKPRLDADVQAERRARPVRPTIAPAKKPEPPPVPPPVERPAAKPPIRAREEVREERPRRPFERPFERRREDDRKPADRPFRPGQDKRTGPPPRQGSQQGPKPPEWKDRPERRPYQRSGPPERQGSDRPERRPPGAKPPARPPYKRDKPFPPRDDRGGRPPMGGKSAGGQRPSGPRNNDRPGGDRPPRPSGGKGPFGPKRGGSGPPNRRPGGPPRKRQ